MSLYTVSSESSVCGSPSNFNTVREASVGLFKATTPPPSTAVPHAKALPPPERTSGVAADYSKQMEGLRDRTSALQRYKLLVNKARLTPERTKENDPAQKRTLEGATSNGLSNAERKTTLTAEGPVVGAFSAPRKDRLPLKERAGGKQGDGSWKTADSDPSSTSRKILPSSTKDHLHNHSNDGKQHVCASDKEPLTTTNGKHKPVELNSQPLGLPEPIEFPSNPRRNTMRPDYEPITIRHNLDDQMESFNSRSSVLKPNTNFEDPPPTSTDDLLSELNSTFPEISEREHQRPSKAPKTRKTSAVKHHGDKPNGKDDKMNGSQHTDSNKERIPANGSQTAFWVRPSSALYEMTASIGAKRKSSAQMEIISEDDLTAHSRVGASYGSTNLSEASPHERRPQFTTYFSAFRGSTKGVDNRSSKMSVRSSNPAASNSSFESPRASLISYDFSGLAKPSQCSSARLADSRSSRASFIPISCRNSQGALSSQPGSSRNRRLNTSESSQSLLEPTSTAKRPQNGGGKSKGGLSTRPKSEKNDVPACEVPDGTALQTMNSSPRTKKRTIVVNINLPQSEMGDFGLDPKPEGRPPKATPGNRSSSGVLSPCSSSFSPRTFQPRENSPSRTSPGLLKNRGQEKWDAATASGGVEAVKAKGADGGAPAALGLPDVDKENRGEVEKGQRLDGNGDRADAPVAPSGGPSAGIIRHPPSSAVEMVRSMMQGILQQTRCVLPCYLCAEMIHATTYHVHLEVCRRTTEGLMKEYAIPPKVWENIEGLASRAIPISSSSQAERDGFVVACYQCALGLVIPCRICSAHIRIHDAKNHEMLCGKASYNNSKAAQRVIKAANHILRHATNVE
ncbi:unnamed protein product [Phytomonas sp. Hart1]|nr:unnamed protein product [Phytomonas sp. Hart1]|eukprot:CCW67731.1 unnamed protein product [Phytomonas sp. isolate Hart1]